MSEPLTLSGRSLIDGAPVAGPSDRRFRATDPVSGEVFEPSFAVAGRAEVDAAVVAAQSACAALGDAERRSRFLAGVASRLEQHADAIVARAGRESALPEPRLRGELARTAGQLRMFAREVEDGSWVDARIDRADPSRTPPKPDVRSMLVPIGPVVVFGAANFPLAFSTLGGDTASAWAAGNPVIVKGHPAHPGTAELAARAAFEAAADVGLPAGVLSLLVDDGHEVGAALVSHPGVRAVAFTGSQRGGLALARIAAARGEPIPVFAEMGSVNPVVVLPGAIAERRDELAAQLVASCGLGNGQFCTSPGLLFVPQGPLGDALVGELATRVRASVTTALLTPGGAAAYVEGCARLAAAGALLLAEGRAEESASPGLQRLWQVEASAVVRSSRLVEEVFGPSSLVVRWGSETDLARCIEQLPGQLTATLHASEAELAKAGPLLALLAQRAGRVLVGGVPTGVEVGAAMVHGGPFPASTDPRTTSVGTRAMLRFVRLLAFQDLPDPLLPPELRDDNPRGIRRLVDGRWDD